MQKLSLSLLSAALLAGSAFGQCFSVTTLTTAGNGQKGTMFNVVNNSAAPVSIGSFDQCFLAAGTSNVEIYTRAGGWSGFESNAGAWTLVGTANGMVHGAFPVLDPIPVAVGVTILPGATQGFYITSNAGFATNVAYTTGVNQLNTVIGSDPSISVTAGVGKSYPFAATFGLPTAGRLWNGRVNYCPSGAGTVLATNTTTGAGCLAAYNSFYEQFANATTASAALSGNVLFLSPTANGYSGAWAPGAAAGLYVTPVAPTVLTTGDDGVVAVTPTSPLSTPYGPQATLQISGNAIIGFGAGLLDYPGTNSYTPTAAGFLNSTIGGIYAWHDYNAAEVGSGPIQSEEIGGTLYITFNAVENYANPEIVNPSTLQFQLDLATGAVRIVWVSVDANATSTFGSGHLVGVTAPGASQNPGSINLATATLLTQPDVLPLAMAATSRPIIGTNWGFTTSNVPAPTIVVEIIGLSDPNIADLFFIGMPGCGLRANLDLLNAAVVVGPSHSWSFAVPNLPALLNLHVYASSGALAPVNAFGAITSNGIDGLIGDF